MVYGQLFDVLHDQLKAIQKNQEEPICNAGRMMADTIMDGGLIHTFGTGHSQIFSMEMFYRAGGLVPVNLVYAPCFCVHPHAPLSTYFERQEGLAEQYLQYEPVKPGDTAVITSISGRNAVPVEMAMGFKKRGAKVVALTSREFSNGVASRHSSGTFFFDYADVIIDIGCVKGDATLALPQVKNKFGPTSSILGFTIIQAMVAKTVGYLAEAGIDPPLFVSSNVDGGDELNQSYLDQYKERIHTF